MGAGSSFFDWFRRFVDDGMVRDLPSSELRALIVLLRHSNRELKAWPGASRIGDLTGLSPASTYRALEALHRRGVVESKEEQIKGGRGRMYRVRVYCLCLPVARSHQRERPTAEHVLTRDTREVLNTEVPRELPIEQPKLPDAPVRETDNGAQPTAGNGQARLTESDLRELVAEWLREHPSDEPLEQRAKNCAYALQHRGVQIWVRQVLATIQASQEVAGG